MQLGIMAKVTGSCRLLMNKPTPIGLTNLFPMAGIDSIQSLRDWTPIFFGAAYYVLGRCLPHLFVGFGTQHMQE